MNMLRAKGLDNKFLIKNPSASEVYIQDIFKYDKIKQKFVATGWIPTFLEELMARVSALSESMFKGGELK